MNNTHYTQRLKNALTRHGRTLRTLTACAVLGSVVIAAEDTSYTAHFLQRTPVVQQMTSSAASSVRPTPPDTIINRAAERRSQRIIERRATVTSSEQQSVVTTAAPLRKAAPTTNTQTSAIRARRAIARAEQTQASSASISITISSEVSSAAVQETASAPSSVSSVVTEPAPDFPAFGRAVHPVSRIPDWGAMTTPTQWNRTYNQYAGEDFVRTPIYNLQTLTLPMDTLLEKRSDPETIKALTAKLYYSTRFFGAYDLDAGEFSGIHPGIDLKLAENTPVGSIAGGRVHDVRKVAGALGLHVLIEHHAPDGNTYYSIYGHLDRAYVQKGDEIKAGQAVGTVGMTGNTSGPHLHLQIDRGEAGEANHDVYWPTSMPSRNEAERHTVNPITFIRQYADGM